MALDISLDGGREKPQKSFNLDWENSGLINQI